MSLWVNKKAKNGKQYQWAIDIDPLIVIPLIGVLATFFLPVLRRDPLSSVGALVAVVIFGGLGCLVISKISVYRKGIWNSWGTSLMSHSMTRLYKVGYALLLVGVLFLIMLIKDLR
jgi:hypothetical protein